MIIIPHVLNGECLDGGRRGFPLHWIAPGKQRRPERASGKIVRALQFAGHGSGQLRLDDFEIRFGQCGGKFIVREQLHAAFKLIGQHRQRKIGARRFVRADVIQRLLEGQPVQRFRAVGEELVQRPVHAVPAFRRFDLGIAFDPAIDADRVADDFRLYDEFDAVGQIGDHGMQRGRRNFNLLRYLPCPSGQLDPRGLRRGERFFAAKTL